jgi:anaerobic ribonucleoside-triphosphate reductase activating protein
MALLNVAGFVPCTVSEGPGRRSALWVQGCAKRCRDCCNPLLLPLVPREIVAAEDLWAWVASAREREQIEGITFLGGEPLLQAQGLARLAALCQEAGLSVMVFTGYTREELEELRLPGTEDLLSHTDILVDGPYLPDLAEDQRNWVGSKNQRFFYLTERYAAGLEFDPRYRRSVELRIGREGTVRLNGWPTDVRVQKTSGPCQGL